MGIPYYFYSLTQKYNNILANTLPANPDIYCIDFNGIIHTIAQDIMKTHADDIDNKIIEAVWNKIEYYIETIKEKKYIICADGVAPLAKMVQQRKRRYLSIFRDKLDNTKSVWDTNAITPGTLFMQNLNTYIKKQIRYNSHNTTILYSGSDENGEGEHKIFDKLILESDDDTIIINGLDADLIILSLISHKKNIYLMRENKDHITQKVVCNYLNIHELRKAIITELTVSWNILDGHHDIHSDISNDLIETYCVGCSILGNDFIPHLLTVDLKADGIDKLMKSIKTACTNHGLLIKNGSINHACLTDIFLDLAKSEDTDIHTMCGKNIKKRVPDHSIVPSDYYAIKNKEILANYIYNNPAKWRHEYYKALFDSNITLCSTVLFHSCQNYVKGIYWTYSYYKKKGLDYDWYYPYTYPPTIKDIANHAVANPCPEIIKKGSFVPSYIQLLVVLPKESKHLVKKEHQKYMDSIYAGLYHMYPDKYKIQTFLKTHLWESSPILPSINIQYIQRVLSL